jgi:CRISPR-associated protein Cmr4
MTHAAALFFHCISPLHAGVGQGVDVVDLAIARDRATGYPYLPGSSIKGSLRDAAKQGGLSNVIPIFGPETANASDHAGAVAFGDANLLCMPVRSVAGTFAWATSPWLLHRALRDLKEAGVKAWDPAKVPNPKDDDVYVTDQNSLLGLQVSNSRRVFFEDFDFAEKQSPDVRAIAGMLAGYLFPDDSPSQSLFCRRFCVVSDNVMSFLSRHATDVVTRVSIDPDTRTAKDGQLWTEENLPAESILLALTASIPMGKRRIEWGEVRKVILELTKAPQQFGGKATVGRGRCQVRVVGGEA